MENKPVTTTNNKANFVADFKQFVDTYEEGFKAAGLEELDAATKAAWAQAYAITSVHCDFLNIFSMIAAAQQAQEEQQKRATEQFKEWGKTLDAMQKK